MTNRTRPEQPDRGTSSLDEWRRDRADAKRLDPKRFKRAVNKAPEPEPSIDELLAEAEKTRTGEMGK